MSEGKRERVDNGYASQDYSNISSNDMLLTQPIILSPIVTVNGEQYIEIDPGRLPNYQNTQQNLVYFIVPKDANIMQGMPTAYIIPDEQQTNKVVNFVEPINTSFRNKTNNNDEVIVVPDDQGINVNKNVKHEDLTDYDQDGDSDPLEIREHVSYAVAKRYNDAVQEASTENVIHNEFIWKTNINCDLFPACKVVLTSYHEKKLHMDEHNYPAGNAFKCSICNMVFAKAIDRNKHIETHSIPNNYECDACLKKFPYYTSYVQHLHDDKCPTKMSRRCGYCGLHFPHGDDLLDHHRQLKQITCVCKTKMCGSEAYDDHCYSCPQLINKKNKKKGLISNSSEIIVLD